MKYILFVVIFALVGCGGDIVSRNEQKLKTIDTYETIADAIKALDFDKNNPLYGDFHPAIIILGVGGGTTYPFFVRSHGMSDKDMETVANYNIWDLPSPIGKPQCDGHNYVVWFRESPNKIRGPVYMHDDEFQKLKIFDLDCFHWIRFRLTSQ